MSGRGPVAFRSSHAHLEIEGGVRLLSRGRAEVPLMCIAQSEVGGADGREGRAGRETAGRAMIYLRGARRTRGVHGRDEGRPGGRHVLITPPWPCAGARGRPATPARPRPFRPFRVQPPHSFRLNTDVPPPSLAAPLLPRPVTVDGCICRALTGDSFVPGYAARRTHGDPGGPRPHAMSGRASGGNASLTYSSADLLLRCLVETRASSGAIVGPSRTER